jgi:hypothetical protein
MRGARKFLLLGKGGERNEVKKKKIRLFAQPCAIQHGKKHLYDTGIIHTI